MRTASAILAPVLVSLAMAGGCSSSSETTAPPGFPPRPVELAVDTVDPCSMFAAVQQAQLGLRKATPTRPTVNGTSSVGCVWLSRSGVNYNTQTIRIGAQVAATDPATTLIEINGFGAVRNVVGELTGGVPTCQVTIDVAQDRSIRVQALGNLEPRPSDEEMCRLATDAASKVMTTVVAIARR